MNHKIKTRTQLKYVLQNLKRKKKKIVFTNGCFDLIHVGHVKYLKAAKKTGDCLVVAINSDASVRKLKGVNRPIIRLKERMEILSAFYFVDYVVSFGEKTPANIIKELKPDVLVKGSDYRIDQIVGNDIVKKYGGIIKTVPLVKGKSTSALIKKLCQTYSE